MTALPHPISFAFALDRGVATITLDRPDRLNALTFDVYRELADTFDALDRADEVRAIVITGRGRGFCSGGDQDDIIKHLLGKDTPALLAFTRLTGRLIKAMRACRRPIIAAVNGIAAGAGASIAFACDLRLVADTAGFNLAFTAIGLSCDTGASWTLPRLVGQAKARELLLMPTTVDAQEALALALATRVVPAADLAAEAAALAAKLAQGPTMAYAAVKEALAYAAAHSLEESLVREAELMARTGGSTDHRRAVVSFLAKEQPTFTGR